MKYRIPLAMVMASLLSACHKPELSAELLPPAASAAPLSHPSVSASTVAASASLPGPIVMKAEQGASFSIEASRDGDWFAATAAANACMASESPAQKLDELRLTGTSATTAERSDAGAELTETVVQWTGPQGAPITRRYFRSLNACQATLPGGVPKGYR